MLSIRTSLLAPVAVLLILSGLARAADEDVARQPIQLKKGDRVIPHTTTPWNFRTAGRFC